MQEEAEQATETADKLGWLVKQYGDDQNNLDLLVFLGRHPHTRFSQMALAYALDTQRLNIERPLRYLISEGLVKMWLENGLPLYSLTEDESLAIMVSQLVSLDWHKWQLILKQSRA